MICFIKENCKYQYKGKNIQQIIPYHLISPADNTTKMLGHKKVSYHKQNSLSDLTL